MPISRSADISFNRKAGFGIVLLANVADMTLDQLAAHILAPTRIPAPSPIVASDRQASPYSGVYPLSPSFAITIFKSDDRLYGQATGQPALVLVSRGRETFDVQGVDATVTFDVDALGNVTGLTLHQNGRDMHAVKSP